MPKELPELTIRRLTTGDTRMLYDFFEACSARTRHLMCAHPYDLATAERLTSPAEIALTTTIRFAAVTPEVGGEAMAGYVFLWALDKKVPWLGIAVADRFQGRGVGTALMAHAANLARAAGKGGILLTTMKQNSIALSMYLKCGYERIGESLLSDPAHPPEHLLLLNFPDETQA